MPYIPHGTRRLVDAEIGKLARAIEHATPAESGLDGVVNYAITRIVDSVYDAWDHPRYARLSRAVGVLECVKQELYRRVVAPYEDEKMSENGDVYGRWPE